MQVAEATITDPASVSLDDFRSILTTAMAAQHTFLICNFDRSGDPFAARVFLAYTYIQRLLVPRPLVLCTLHSRRVPCPDVHDTAVCTDALQQKQAQGLFDATGRQ